ncbi:MAG: DNA-directed RNA polymerase subunit P [Halobacteriota archaeon]|nr:DNA-directed RNA polymerase subunit P [Halobacteriota archaeon]
MGYYCSRCKRDVEIDYEYQGIRCHYCGNRILIKKAPITIKKVNVE